MPERKKVDLQVRGVPLALQRRVRARAARKGMSMSKYVIQILEDSVEEPGTLNDWLEELAKLPPVPGYRPGDGTAAIRAIRDAVDRA